MTTSLEGRVALVTGAGRGIGRDHALLLAARGAAIVVSDVGAELDGSGHDTRVAAAVVDEIVESGGGRSPTSATTPPTSRGALCTPPAVTTASISPRATGIRSG